MFELTIDRGVERALKKPPRDAAVSILTAIQSLGTEPRPHGYRKIVGTDHCFRIRVGDYRVIYELDDSRSVVVIHAAGHRKDVYRGFE
jgi:mRNA interferase RelE/StbE